MIKTYDLYTSVIEANKIAGFLQRRNIAPEVLAPLIWQRGDTIRWNVKLDVEPYCNSYLRPESMDGKILLRREAREHKHGRKHQYTIGVFLPGNRLLIDLNDPFAREFFHAIRFSLRNELGYRILKSKSHRLYPYPDIYGSRSYLNTLNLPVDNEYYSLDACCDLLHYARKNSAFRAFDERAMQILDVLMNSLPNGKDLTYTFAAYELRQKAVFSEDNYEIEDVAIKMRHKKLLRLRGSDISEDRLEQICKRLPVSWALGIKSNVSYNGKDYHIPMIDFAPGIYINDSNIRQLLASEYNLGALKKNGLEMDGMVVESGASLHFYGFRPLSTENWQRFMMLWKTTADNDIEAQLSSLVDHAFFDIQLASGSTLLRLTPCLLKPTQPCAWGIYSQDKLREFRTHSE